MTDPIARVEAVLADLHRRGDWTEEGWRNADDGLECFTCGGRPCVMPEALAVVRGTVALREALAAFTERVQSALGEEGS